MTYVGNNRSLEQGMGIRCRDEWKLPPAGRLASSNYTKSMPGSIA
jgi:hypothetical protein